MKPSQLKTFLVAAIKARVNVLVQGPPGIGKTDITNAACVELDADHIVSHLAVADPTDMKGLPWFAKGDAHASFKAYGAQARILSATKLTVWDFEDMGQASAAVQASAMQALLSHKINEHVIPCCVSFVASTNRRTDRAGVTGILEPVKSRFGAIVSLEPDLDEWCQWAFTQTYIPATLIAFLRFRPDLLCAFNPSADLTNSPLPRTWANVGKLLALALPRAIEAEAIAGAVGAGAATELLAFLDLYMHLPSIDSILLDPDRAPLPDKPAARYAIVTALATKATPTNFDRIAKYAQRLLDAGFGEFAALLARDSVRRNVGITTTAGFIRLASGDLGTLISGGNNS